MPPKKDAAGGMLLVAEYFDREDDRFVEALREVYDAPKLAGFVDRWKMDPRPWARRQVFVYLEQPLNVPGHHVLVKRLFKQAESARDHEQTAAFLTAFDRLIRRERRTKRRYEWVRETNQVLTHETESLVSPRDHLLPPLPRQVRNPRTGEKFEIPPPSPYFLPHLRMFSGRTRHYLQRRAWRYFRKLGFQYPTQYVSGVATALLRYVDDDFAQPENMLDSWGFIHVCFGKHSAIEFSALSAAVKAGRSTSELTAAPYFEPLWADVAARPVLWRLLLEAGSRAVRVWARQLLERHHAESLQSLTVETFQKLLAHDDAELQQFGAMLLGTVQGVDQWPVAVWLELLKLRDPTALSIVCEQMTQRVSGDRLDLTQTLELVTARATPVAAIGLKFLRGRKWDAAEDRRRLTELSNMRCDALAAESAKFALALINSSDRYERDVVVALFDSLAEPMRATASTWFAGHATAQDDPILWTRLIETPFDDVRLAIVDLLKHRATRPRVDARDLAPLWSSVLLAVHRGGRQKLKAVEQLTAAIVDDPERAAKLLPVLGAAVRSIRGPEHRAGLAAVARLLDQHPPLAPLLQQSLPELSFPVVPFSSASVG